MRKILLTIGILFICLSMVGCDKVSETIRRKFIPKKKQEEEKVVRFYDEEYYSAYPNATLYDNHFNYWKAWEQELIVSFSGTNNKKMAQCARFSVSEMKLMQKYLTEPKAGELEQWIKEMQVVERKIDQGGLSMPSKLGMKSTVEKHLRNVDRNFKPSNVKDYIRPDAPPEPQQQEGEEF